MEKSFVITEIIRVIMVGKEEYSGRVTSFSHTFSENELIFHFSGDATVYFNDSILKTTPNTVRFLPQGKVSRYDVVRREQGECIDVIFRADRPISDLPFVLSVAQAEKIGALFKKLFSTWVGRHEGYYFKSLSLLYKILAELQCDKSAPRQHTAKIQAALDEIHAYFLKKDLPIPQLAALCGMGESYFQRLFRERFGIAPKKYIIQLKLNHACDLLRTERYSITQVAELCGFSDVYFFSRQFKAHLGITPTQFVKKYKSSK